MSTPQETFIDTAILPFDIVTTAHVHYLFKAMQDTDICKGYMYEKRKEHADKCAGYITDKHKTDMCSVCHQKQAYLHVYQSARKLARKRKRVPSNSSLEEEEEEEVMNKDPDGIIDYSEDDEEIDDGMSDIDDETVDPNYDPEKENKTAVNKMVKQTQKLKEGMNVQSIIDDMIKTAPSLDNPQFKSLIASQLQNGSRIKTLHKWDTRW
jgi:hypothetical protein